MDWIEIGITVADPSLEEVISAILFELGASGVYFDTEKDLIKGYLPKELIDSSTKNRLKDALKKIKSIFSLQKDISFYIKPAEQIDWVEEWKRFFKPIRVTDLLTVIPCWESEKGIETKYVIKIDPGPAFGTAQHPTTQLCLKLLESFKGKESLLDIGTGTGILAIYAAMLGIKKILAIDIDPVALRWADHNLALNRVKDKVVLSSKRVDSISDKFSIIVANLLFDELKEVIPSVPFILKEVFIVSGILKEQLSELKEMLERYGLYIKKSFFQEEWAALLCEKR